jgi:hypothetical protein
MYAAATHDGRAQREWTQAELTVTKAPARAKKMECPEAVFVVEVLCSSSTRLRKLSTAEDLPRRSDLGTALRTAQFQRIKRDHWLIAYAPLLGGIIVLPCIALASL